MKILIAVHHFPPRYTGGAEWRVYRTAQALQARGYSIRVICIEHIDRGETQEVTWHDEIFEGVAVRRLSFNLKNAPDPERWEFNNLWVSEQLRQLIQQDQPNVLHLFSGYLMSGSVLALAHELNLPSIVSLTDFWFLCRRLTMWRSNGQLSQLPLNPVTCARCLGEERRLFRWPGRLVPQLMNVYWRRQTDRINLLQDRSTFLLHVLNQAHTIISPSQFLRSLFAQAGLNPHRIVYMRQGRDFPGLTEERMEKTPAGHLRVGYLGQIAEHKGVHILLEALRYLPQASLTVDIYGDFSIFPRYVSRLRRMAASDARIRLVGRYQGQSQLSSILRNLDVLVIPSIWYENSPNVILEAFAHHTPVIVSNLGGMAELVTNNKDGLHFTPGDSSDLARVMRRILNEPDLLNRLQSGIEPIKSIKQEIDELEEIYQNVVAAGRQLS